MKDVVHWILNSSEQSRAPVEDDGDVVSTTADVEVLTVSVDSLLLATIACANTSRRSEEGSEGGITEVWEGSEEGMAVR